MLLFLAGKFGGDFFFREIVPQKKKKKKNKNNNWLVRDYALLCPFVGSHCIDNNCLRDTVWLTTISC